MGIRGLCWRAPWIAAVCLALAFIGPGLAGVAGAGEKQKLVVWWNKGYYKEEDEGLQKIADAWAKENNIDLELTFTIQDDLGPKIISALIARRVPDVAFCFFNDFHISPKFAWDGKLTDVSDLIMELKPRYIESHMSTGRLYNNAEKKWAYYAIPIEAQALGSHYWKDMVQEAGLNPDPKKIPMAWNEHWAFWKKVQNTLRKKDPAKYGKLFGIGMTESSRSTDTIYNFEQYLFAFHGEVITPEGKVVAGEAKNRDAIVKTLTFFTGIYKEGYVPPDALTWTDADNNVNFNNRTVVMTPNPSISIPGAHFFSNKDNYYNKIGSILQPTSPIDGKGYPYLISVKQIIIPKDAKNPELGKKFVKHVLEAKNFLQYVKGSNGRWFPSFKDVGSDSFFNDPKDPHVSLATQQHTKYPTRPFYFSYHPAYVQVYTENVWGKAISRVVSEKWSNEQAVDEAVTRIEQIFKNWK